LDPSCNISDDATLITRYLASDKPAYKTGHAIMIGLNVMSFICTPSERDKSNLSDLDLGLLVKTGKCETPTRGT
jgi:hypothetical protein